MWLRISKIKEDLKKHSWSSEARVSAQYLIDKKHNTIYFYKNKAKSFFNIWADKTIHVNLCKKLHNPSQKE